jgi:hypothetical protein
MTNQLCHKESEYKPFRFAWVCAAILSVTWLSVDGKSADSQQNGSASQKPSLAERDRRMQEEREISRRQDEAYDKGGLRAAAAVTGTYVMETFSDPENNASTLARLVEWTPNIIVGRIDGAQCWLDGGGELITTDYKVAIERVLKTERTRFEKFVTVSILGGTVRFSKGTVAQVTTRPMTLPTIGDRYVLFIAPTEYHPGPDQRNAAKGPQIYSLPFKALGAFQLRTDGTVEPQVSDVHPIKRAYSGKSEFEFVSQILALVPRSQQGH